MSHSNFLYSPEEDPSGSGPMYDDFDLGQDPPLKDVSGLFNERGFYKSNGFSFNEEEIVNDFSGNLLYNIPLYNYKLAGDLFFDMKLVYNGAVSHSIKIANPSILQTGLKNAYNMNMPEWILSVNGICVQAFNFITKYFSKPTAPASNLEGYDINMQISGYHYSNDLRVYSTESLRDTITLLMGDGSTVTLENSDYSGTNEELRYVGNYRGKGKENYIKAKVAYLQDPEPYPYYRARKITLLKGDGLEYVFREVKNEFIDFTEVQSLRQKPMMPLLIEINNRFGNIITFDYTTAYNEGSGRPMISSIRAPGISSQQPSINFGFTFGPRTCLIEHQSNLNEWYDIKFEDESVNYHYSNNGNKIGRVKKITNCLDQTFEVEYQTNSSDLNYIRSYTGVFDPFTLGSFTVNFNKLRRIRKIKNFLGLRRDYDYTGAHTQQIHVHSLYSEDPPNILSPDFKGYGRDPFFTNMLQRRLEYYNDPGIVEKSETFYNYIYDKVNTINGQPRNLGQHPIYEGDVLKTVKTINSKDNSTINNSISSISYTYVYKIYPLYDPNNHFAFSPDVDGTTKLMQQDVSTNGVIKVEDFEYYAGTGDPLTGGYNGSFLMKKKIETYEGASKQWEWEYVHKNDNVNEFVIENREKDPFNAKKIKKFKDFLVDFNRILFNNTFDLTGVPLVNFNYFSYGMIEDEYIELLSVPGIKNNRKKYYFIETINDARGYIGQIIKDEIFENNGINKVSISYLYCKNDRTGEGIFQASTIFPFKEGNLKELVKPNGQVTKYYYHPISLDEVVIVDEPNDIPYLKFFVKNNNNSVVENSEKIWDHRFPIRIDNVKRISSTDSLLLTNYKSYTPDGSPEKNISYQKFVTEFKYMPIHRIKKITFPGDFSNLPDEIVINTIHNYQSVEKIVTSNKWGSFRIYQNMYIGSFTQNINDINEQTCRPFFTKYSAIDPTYIHAFMGFDKNEFKNITALERAELKIRPLYYDMRMNGIPIIADRKIKIRPVNYLQQRAYNSIFCSGGGHIEYYFNLTNYASEFQLNIQSVYPSCGFTTNDVSLDIKGMIQHSSINNIDFLGLVIYPVFPIVIPPIESGPSGPEDPEPDPDNSSDPAYAILNMTLCNGFSNINVQNSWLQYFSPRIDLKGTIDYPIHIPKTIFKSGTLGYEYDDFSKEINIYSIRNSISFDASRTRFLLDAYGNIKRKDITVEETIPNPTYNSYYSNFNFMNKLALSKDAAGNETKFSYDGLQRLIRTYNADGSDTKTVFSYLGAISDYYFVTVPGSFIEKQVFTDENGNNFEKYYDSLGNLRREVKFISAEIPSQGDTPPPIKIITDYLYDSLNRLIKVKTPETKIIEYQYDGYGRQNRRITVDSGIIKFQYDSNNNLVTSQDTNQSAIANYIFTFRKYDALNRVTVIGENSLDRGDFSQIDPDSDIDYTIGDNPDPYFDFLVINVYDNLDTTSVPIFTPPSDYIPNSQNYHYFTKGRLVATAYRTRKLDPWDFKYYKYDERGRVKTIWHVLNGIETKKIEYTYNSQDQVVSNTVMLNPQESKRFKYDYDKPGRLRNLWLYFGAETMDDPLDYKNLVQYSYNTNSMVSRLGLNENKLKNDYTYNDRNWIQNCISQEGVFSYNMFYFPNGNVQSLDLNGNYNNNFYPSNDLMFEFSYDKSNRLLLANCSSFSNNGYDIDNTYDKDGNILTLKRYRSDGSIKDNFTYVYYPGTNRLKKVSTIYNDYLYDLNGNLIKDDLNKNFEIKYDHRNLITFLKHNIYGLEGEVYTQAVFYYYDDQGNRIRKVILQSYFINPEIPLVLDELKNYPEYDETSFNKDAADYLNDSLDNPIMWFLVSNEYCIRDKEGRDFLLLKGDVLEKCNLIGRDNEGFIDLQNNKYYYLKDHLGSIRAVANSSNNIISAQDYDMWGFFMEGRSFDSYKSKFKFTGKERDNESNLDYFGARYYESRIARWESVDPLFEKHYDFTPYNYVLNNPLKFIDPDGKQKKFSKKLMEAWKKVSPVYNVAKEIYDFAGNPPGLNEGIGEKSENLFRILDTDVDVDKIPDSQEEIDNRSIQQKAMDEYILSKPNEYNIPERLQRKNIKEITESDEEIQLRKDFKEKAEYLKNNQYKIYEKWTASPLAEKAIKKDK